MKTKNGYKQTSLSSKVLLIAGLSMVIGLAGCQEEGTAEQEGKKIDRAVEKASEKIEAAKQSMNEKIDDSAKSTKGTLESAGQKIDQQTEEAKQKIDQETEKAGKKLENAKESVTDSAEKTGEYISDSVITAKVKTAIFGDPVLRTSHIDVTTVNGVVKLSGTVDSEQSLGRAMELAGSQKDVNSVVTTLVVVEPGK